VKDEVLGLAWMGGLVLGFAAVATLRRVGLPRTYARDLLHVGAGVWIIGWPWWTTLLVPLLVAWGTFALVAAVPYGASRSGVIGRARDSVAGEGEQWAGIVAYAASFAVLTTLALAFHQVTPAACAAAALSAGDGLGGLLGRRFGRHRFKLPWSKFKTWEGTAAVAFFSGLGVAVVLRLLSRPTDWGTIALLGVTSAAAEALAPRAWDNLTVPAAVFGVARLLG
jgi:phytol kinase